MTKVQMKDGKLLFINDKLAVGEKCCCGCGCDNCCASMVQWYAGGLNYSLSSSCGSSSGLASFISGGWEVNCAGGDATICGINLTCISDSTRGKGIFSCSIHMESSAPCDYTATLEQEGDCFPPSLTFVFEDTCCGDMTVTFSAPNCDLPCYCRCDNHCLEEVLHVSLENISGCEEAVMGIELTCYDNCRWQGEGTFVVGYEETCHLSFDLSGDGVNNCRDQYTLSVTYESTTITKRSIGCDSVCYPTDLKFGPYEIPCCGTVYFHVTS